MKRVLICFLGLSIMMLSQCSLDNSKKNDSEENKKVVSETVQNNGDKTSVDKTKEDKTKEDKNDEDKSSKEIIKKVKDYINNGQNDKPEATKLKWSKTFLDKVDIESLYKKYKADNKDLNNIEKFAEYITLNAPILENWQELFKKDLKNTYGEEASKLEKLDGDLYQAYVKKDGKEVPYVVVSSRTGYFHG